MQPQQTSRISATPTSQDHAGQRENPAREKPKRSSSSDEIALAIVMIMLALVMLAGAGCNSGGSSGGGAAALALPACGPVTPEDRDGDGLSDIQETEGWNILVDYDGFGLEHGVSVHVTSNPLLCDTDGDGLNDAEEFASRTDPEWTDTDGDLLDDHLELIGLRSNPATADTDGDASRAGTLPSPSLFDGNEYLLSRTSPTLADTDGDGLTDDQEILGGGFNPRVADLPRLSLEVVGDPLVALNARVNSGTQNEVIEATMEREENSQVRVDASNTRSTVENSTTIDVEASSSVFPPGVSYEASASNTFKYGTMSETSTQFTDSSVQSLQQDYQSTTSAYQDITYEDGEVTVAVKVRNESEIAVQVAEMRVLAFRQSPTSAGAIQIVAGLDGDIFSDDDGFLMAPGDELTFLASNLHVNWQNILPYVQNPSGMLFEIGSFEMSQPEQILDGEVVPAQDYAVVGQRVVERTGLIVIDYGMGQIERYQVATNVERRPDGSAAGITLGEALAEVLEVPYETLAQVDSNGPTGLQVLSRVRDHELVQTPAGTPSSFWAVFGPDVIDDDGERIDFDDIVLESGQRIDLVYLTDEDDDGLTRREEIAYGSSDLTPDSDFDGLDDAQEVRAGKRIDFYQGGCCGGLLPQFSYMSYSNPRLVDSDGDGLSDLEEWVGIPYGCGDPRSTDPRDPDTDGDSYSDQSEISEGCPVSNDDSPPPPAPTNGLVLYLKYNADQYSGGDGGELYVQDASGPGFGEIIGYTGDFYFPGPLPSPAEGAYFSQDRFPFISRSLWVENDVTALTNPAFTKVNPESWGSSFTFSVWIFGAANVPLDSAIFGQHEGAALRLENGVVTFEWTEPGATAPAVEIPDSQPLALEEWHLFTVTVSANPAQGVTAIQLYRDTLPVLPSPLEIGTSALPAPSGTQLYVGAAWPAGSTPGVPATTERLWNGIIDDVRVYGRALSAIEVVNIFGENGYTGQ